MTVATTVLLVMVMERIKVMMLVEVHGGSGNLDEQKASAGACVERGRKAL